MSPDPHVRRRQLGRAARLAPLAFLLLLGDGAMAGAPARWCRRHCGDAIAACVEAGGRPAQCRRQVRSRCRSKGRAVCIVPSTTTTTTTVPPLEGPPPTPVPGPSTTTTLPLVEPAVCGNGVREAGEVCDGADLGGAQCAQGGTLACAPNCFWLDHRDCFGCGNGVREGAEACDGNHLGGAACDAPGETGGDLRCDLDCQYDRTRCWRCGNGRNDPGEECDDGNDALNDGCTPACTTECGDGAVQWNEDCDDGDRTSGDGCSEHCINEQQYGGGGDEVGDCNLMWNVAHAVPGATVECSDGEACDRDPTPAQCLLGVSLCFNVYPGAAGTPFCVPSDVTRVVLGPASLMGPAALDPVDQAAFLDVVAAALGAVPGTTVLREPTSVSVTPGLLHLNVCAGTTVAVPAGAARVLEVSARDADGEPDDDHLTFVCAAP